jgi:hypothetical protein
MLLTLPAAAQHFSSSTNVVPEAIEEIPVTCILLDAAGANRLRYALSPIPPAIREAEIACPCLTDISRLNAAGQAIAPEFLRDSVCRLVAAYYARQKYPMMLKPYLGNVYLLARIGRQMPHTIELLGAVPIPSLYYVEATHPERRTEVIKNYLAATPIESGVLSMQDLERIPTRAERDTFSLHGSLHHTPHRTMLEYCKAIITNGELLGTLLNNPAIFRAVVLRASSGKIVGVTGVEYTTQPELLTELTLLQATPELVARLRETYTPTPKKSPEVLAAEHSCATCKEIIAAVRAGAPVDYTLTKGAIDCLEVKYYYKRIADAKQIDNAFVLVERITRGEPRIAGVVCLRGGQLDSTNAMVYDPAQRQHQRTALTPEKSTTFITLDELRRLPADLSDARLSISRTETSPNALPVKRSDEPSLHEYLRDALRRNALPMRATAVAVRYDSLSQRVREFRDVEWIK